MSITGQPQVFNTVKSSWEILDSPVPFRSESSHHLFEPKSKTLLSASNTIGSLRAESSGYSTEQNIFKAAEDTSSTGARPKDQKLNSKLDACGRQESEESVSREQSYNNSGTATYVSSQRRVTEDIAETIATEFGEHVKKSQRSVKKKLNTGEATDLRLLPDQFITVEPENTDFHQLSYGESNLSNTSEVNNSNEESNSSLIHTRPPGSREFSEMSRISGSTAYQGQISHSTTSEHSVMSQRSSDRQRHGVNNLNNSERGRYRNHQGERQRPAETLSMNSQRQTEDQRYQQHEANNFHANSQDLHLPSIYPDNTQTPQRQEDESIIQNEEEELGIHTPGEESMVVAAARSTQETVNHPHVPVHPEGDNAVPRQTMPMHSLPMPFFHPPPTIIQNGISQADLLELMSKGLGQFTTEMAVMVIEKLKPEYEDLAKQVGTQVKESTVTEIKDLQEKLTAAETDLDALKTERDKLKTENSKERDQMKKEFEKDRLKRVKEFEEKKELIDNLQKENDHFKSLLKEKDKFLKKAEGKAKSEEQKRIKIEEESGKLQKELQKELDKIKGELLVQKSKKRLQVSSAQSKKECLGKLNSQHGLYPKQFNGHKPIPYDEGDD